MDRLNNQETLAVYGIIIAGLIVGAAIYEFLRLAVQLYREHKRKKKLFALHRKWEVL